MFDLAGHAERPVTTPHRAKLAYISVRPVPAGQVRLQIRRATELQYRRVGSIARPCSAGQGKRIEVITMISGSRGPASMDGRFSGLIAEIGWARPGLVMS